MIKNQIKLNDLIVPGIDIFFIPGLEFIDLIYMWKFICH